MPSAGLKPAIPEIKLPQTYNFYRTSTGIGVPCVMLIRNKMLFPGFTLQYFWRIKENKEG
jgi:hypothetical protein